MRNRGFWARAIVSIAVCIVLLRFIDWDNLGNTLKAANAYWLFTGFLVIHMDRLFMTYKWSMLLRGSNVSASTGTLVKAYYIGTFWSYFLPSSIGGDAVRATWLVKRGECGSIIVSSIVIERLLGSLALGIVALGSIGLLMVHYDSTYPALSAMVIVLLIMTIMAITLVLNGPTHDSIQKLMCKLRFQRISRVIEKMKVTILEYREKRRLLTAFLVLSIFEQSFPIIGNFIWAKALSIDLSIVWVIIGMPIIGIIARSPISVSGIGVQEGAYAFIFSFAGIPLSASILMSVTGRVVGLLATLPGALWTADWSKGDVSDAVIDKVAIP
jgi:uncharacterized protein (TIRG00374 family)